MKVDSFGYKFVKIVKGRVTFSWNEKLQESQENHSFDGWLLSVCWHLF